MSMHVLGLHAENFKRLTVVDITPDWPNRPVVLISGPNGSGKSSVLDALWAAVAGRESAKMTRQPIRDGEDSAVVTVTLDDYVITRRWAKGGNVVGSLRVTTRDGVTLGTPQKILDGLYSSLTFDPLAFSQLDPASQRDKLLKLITLPYDPVAVEQEFADVYESRTLIGRDLRTTEARLGAMTEPDPTWPTVLASSSTILAELDAARAVNDNRSNRSTLVDTAQAEVDRRQITVDRIQAELNAAIDALSGAVDLHTDAMAAFAAAPPEIDLDPIRVRLASVEDLNRQYHDRVGYENAAADRDALQAQYDGLQSQLDAIAEMKRDALANATLPLPELGFDDKGITFNGVPFGQASSAEKLRISTAMGMALNPALRVMSIKDGSLLDDASMKIIEALTAANQYQLWIETVSETGDGVGIEMLDGAVNSTVSPTTLGP